MAALQAKPFSAKYIVVAFAVPLALMALLQVYFPYLNEIPTHLVDARHIWQGTVDCTAIYRMPLGFPGYLSPFAAVFGDVAGVKIANMFALAIMLAAACAFFFSARRTTGGADVSSPRLPFGMTMDQTVVAIMILALTFYPYTIFNVARSSEALLATVALLVFLCTMFKTPSVSSVVVAAICLGVGIHVRANMISLALPALVWIALRSDRSPVRRCLFALLGVAVMVAAYSACSLLFAGCIWYTPSNGGYNLYAGNNPLAAGFLWERQNGEYSLIPALQAVGVGITDITQAYNFPQESYIALAKQYAVAHPLGAIKLALVKTMVFFSPRWLSADNMAEIIVQAILTAISLFAFGLGAWRFVRTRDYAEGMFLLIAATYALPFVLTNSDPRMRFPIDIMAVCFLVLWFGDWLRHRLVPEPAKR